MLSNDKRQDLIGKFKRETTIHLTRIRGKLALLTEPPADSEALAIIIFSLHTVKGNLGMMHMLAGEPPRLSEVASRLELIVRSLQSGTIQLEPHIVNRLEQGIAQIEIELAQ